MLRFFSFSVKKNLKVRIFKRLSSSVINMYSILSLPFSTNLEGKHELNSC